ncbi:MAG: alpha/beta hydrolase domain-containing protein [Pseudomonadota bacterium]
MQTPRLTRILVGIIVFLSLLWGCSDSSDFSERSATALNAVTVTGPITAGGEPATSSPLDLTAAGYIEEEFFYEGDAWSYRFLQEPAGDGRWDVAQNDTAAFKTRLLVRRPVSAEAFSGVVFVEWLNVTGAFDLDGDWLQAAPLLLREGHAWVGVSVQSTGVNGGQSVLEEIGSGEGLVGSNPERYGTLFHPGDEYAFDMFSQAADALTAGAGPAPLGSLQPSELIAFGPSQSAAFLTTYVNAVHSQAQRYDGIILHSRPGLAAPLDGDVAEDSLAVIQVRTDLTEPVFIIQAENDLTALNYLPARQPDSDTVKLWEIAGVAHADTWVLAEITGAPVTPQEGAAILGCDRPINDGSHREIFRAGVDHMVRWVREGEPPPAAPGLEIASSSPPEVARDDSGIALGGLRHPDVEVPVAALSGEAGNEGITCFLFGSTRPFEVFELAARYASTADYHAQYRAAAEVAVEAGYLLPEEAEALVTRAEARDLGF